MKKMTIVLALVCLIAEAQANAPKKSNAPARKAASDASSVTAPTSTSAFGRAMRGTVIRPMFGLAFVSPSKFNDFLIATYPNESNIRVGGGTTFGVSFEYPVIEDLYLGLRIERMSASGSKVSIGGANRQASVAATPMMFTGTYYFPLASKFKLGPTLGAGLGLGYNGTIEISASENTQQLPNGTLVASATPFRGLFGVSANMDFTRVIGLQLQTGYQFMSSSELEIQKNPFGYKEGSIAKAEDGKSNLEVSGSSFFTTLALSVTL